MIRFLTFFVLSLTLSWAASLTDDAASAGHAMKALAKATGKNPALLDKYASIVQKSYARLTVDHEYKNAHKVYRLLAAMTLTGNEALLEIVDAVWASGIKPVKDNTLLQAIDCQWGSGKTNGFEEKIYQARFEVELYRHNTHRQITFAPTNVWDDFFRKSTKPAQSDSWASYYAQALWSGSEASRWHTELLALTQPKGGALIRPLPFKEKTQTMWGTAGIKSSPLHAEPFYSKFPQVMVLGSLTNPGVNNPFSITVEVAPKRYVVIGQPTVPSKPALRPHYGLPLDQLQAIQGQTQTTQVTIRELNGTKTERTIHWGVAKDPQSVVENPLQAEPTQSGENDGSLGNLDSVKANRYGGYALTVWDQTNSDAYYYWFPNIAQMKWLEGFTESKKEFSFASLVADIAQCDMDARIKTDLAAIHDNPTQFFNAR